METEKKYRLPKEFAEKWIAALRSGKYKQDVGTLVKTNGNDEPAYCCMGIAGLVCGKSDGELKGNGYFFKSMPEQSLGIPEELIVPNNRSACQTLAGKLSNLNDADQLTFPQIADWIEQNVELY